MSQPYILYVYIFRGQQKEKKLDVHIVLSADDTIRLRLRDVLAIHSHVKDNPTQQNEIYIHVYNIYKSL